MSPLRFKKVYGWMVLALAAGAAVVPFASQELKSFAESPAAMAIQHNGRIKPFESFARETLRFVSGREEWQKRPAYLVFMDLLADPAKALDTAWVRLDYKPLKEMLQLPAQEKYFSFNRLKPAFPHITMLVDQSRAKRDRDERPTVLEQRAETLYSRLITVGQLSSGEIFTMIPTDQGHWLSPFQNQGTLANDFKAMTAAFGADPAGFARHAQKWIASVKDLSAEADRPTIGLEISYYRWKPFHWAWICYLAAFVWLFFLPQRMQGVGLGLTVVGFILHTAGLGMRIAILERPPVSNMYESMIFMNWILIICAFIFFLMKRKTFVLTTAAVVSALVMIYADLLPIEKSLDVLAPVLRSHYWLMVHVLTIVASYGIFGLAMALGHRQLFLDRLHKLSPEEGAVSANLILRLIQVGLLALGVGTFLGGVWANESWGRFWGWDPKETWSLITFLGYLVVVHLRSARKLNDFGLALSTIVGFLLVLMTWYGVNFLLGRGLHSYGSGSGGAIWIVYYLIFEVFFLLFVFFQRDSKRTAMI